MWDEITETLIADFKADPAIAANLKECETLVGSSRMAPGVAARKLVGLFKR